jgi:signal transduction histidine kinase
MVVPVNEDLPAALAHGSDEISPFQRFLHGFANTMLPSSPPPPMTTKFVIHEDGLQTDVIDPEGFWAPDDFDLVDHVIQGSFDAYGQFVGSVSVYRGDPQEYVDPWMAGKGRRTRCGPFTLTLGYLQGSLAESLLSADDFALMNEKLRQLGGLYIYRDGIRVLPYGNSDVDYLEIEQRRSRRAATAFFSYRRMFGAIEVSGETNPELQEKAGREGFRDNAAYRDFVDVLQEFLANVARNFFVEGGAQAQDWSEGRASLKLRADARRDLERRERQLRRTFLDRLEVVLDALEQGGLRDAAGQCLRALDEELAAADSVRDILEAEGHAVEALEQIRAQATVDRPNVGLTVAQERDWEAYRSLWQTVGEKELQICAGQISTRVAAALEKSDATRRESFDLVAVRRKRLHERVDVTVRQVEDLRGEVDRRVDTVTAQVRQRAQEVVAEFEDAVSNALQLSEDDPSAAHQEATVALLTRQATESSRELRTLLDRVDWTEGGDATRQLKDQVLDLELQVEENLELLQLGQAVQIVSHEFEASIRSVRAGLRKLDPWARSNSNLAETTRDLKASFQHLDGYLRLFTPLQRRLYRRRVAITGNEILQFVAGVFVDRLPRHNVELVATPAFANWVIEGFPSTFYPVFVNLVDNAIHWLSTSRDDDRHIVFDADDDAIFVIDNGPGVPAKDAQAIFERGFTRRRAGRGLGLSISQDLLRREGWALSLDASRPGEGARFRLTPPPKES